MSLTSTTPGRLEVMFRRNIRYFERIVTSAEADKSITLSIWQGCLRAAEKRLERHLEENQSHE